VEGLESKELDILAGIDAWQLCYDKSRMRGIASRVQQLAAGKERSPYNTFTIRWLRPNGNETEYAKRLAAIRDPGSWLYPSLTIQAYVDCEHDRVISAAMVQTRDLYEFVEQTGPSLFPLRHNNDGSSNFRAVPWYPRNRFASTAPSLSEGGVTMKTYDCTLPDTPPNGNVPLDSSVQGRFAWA